MNHFTYHQRLLEIWSAAVEKYETGNREPGTYFSGRELADLASIGLGVMDVYDYVEDFVDGGYPDFTAFAMISEARRDYFFNAQNGEASTHRIDSASLPAKDSALRGIRWLPRIIPKALGKLRGELPPDTMYGCGGDRGFLKENDIHPAEFLRVVWACDGDPEKIADWVEARRAQRDL